MIEIAGGVTDPQQFMHFCEVHSEDAICKSPPEFPHLLEDFHDLIQSDADYKQSLTHAEDSFLDRRVRAVFAMAPALGPAFSLQSLKEISVPVQIVAGTADTNVPVPSNARIWRPISPMPSSRLFLGSTTMRSSIHAPPRDADR
jgi:predicted dienelactone hydrolase